MRYGILFKNVAFCSKNLMKYLYLACCSNSREKKILTRPWVLEFVCCTCYLYKCISNANQIGEAPDSIY